MNFSIRKKSEALIIFSLSLLLFCVGLNHQEFIAFETRFALFAKEMLQHGFTWFPTTYHQPYPDYPVTATYLIYLLSSLSGHFTKLTAVLPSAIAAAITLATTYAIGALTNKRWGLFAVLLLIMTGTFFFEARSISLDQYTTAVTCLCFYCAYSAEILQKPRRRLWIPLLLVCGFLFRGPIGLIIPASVTAIFYLLDKNYKQFIVVGITATLLLLLCSTILFYIAYHMGGVAFSKEVLSLEITSRMHHGGHNPPHYFYFLDGLGAYALTFPLSLLVVIGLNRTLFTKPFTADIKLLQKLAAWALIILVGLSIPADKKMRYVLAISPALALISAYLFIIPQDKKFFHYLYKIILKLLYFVPLISLIIATGIFFFLTTISLNINFPLTIIIFLSLILLNAISNKNPNKHLKEFVVLLTATLSFVTLTIFYLEPINLYLNRSQDFVVQLETVRQQQHAQLVFYQEGRDGLPIKYMVNSPADDVPLFLSDPASLATVQTKAFFIAGETEFAQIPSAELNNFQIIAKNLVGRKKIIVFTQRQLWASTDLTTISKHLAK